jgi:CheY-like chemotaxis protein
MISDQVFLYVEDDVLSREALELILKRVMHVKVVHLFEDSSDFMARVRALPAQPNVILLDIHMSPHNGFEMLSMLRQDPQYQHAHIVALTASVMNEEVELLKQSGFDGVIAKPINVMDFPALIQRVAHGESIWHIAE